MKTEVILTDTCVSDAMKGYSKREGPKPLSLVPEAPFEIPTSVVERNGAVILEPVINAQFPEVELRELSFSLPAFERLLLLVYSSSRSLINPTGHLIFLTVDICRPGCSCLIWRRFFRDSVGGTFGDQGLE